MNVLKFQEVYGFVFGRQGSKSVVPDTETSHYRIGFTTPRHPENQLRFEFPQAGYLYGGRKMLRLYDGDDLLTVVYEHKRRLDFFSAITNDDPLADRRSPLPSPGPGGQMVVGSTAGWLKLDHYYEIEIERLVGHSSRTPVSLVYTSGDSDDVVDDDKAEALRDMAEVLLAMADDL